MAAPLILARTFKDAHAYAQGKLGLTIGYYRVVNSPGTIKAVRGRDLHLVPGWDKRPDRFSMRSAIRYCRNTVIDVAALKAADETVDPRGDLTERQLDVAYRYNALLSLPEDIDEVAVTEEATAQVTQDDEPRELGPHGNATTVSLEEALEMQDPAFAEKPEPTEPPKKRRRSKCSECGNLHYKTDPCPTSESV